MDSPEIPARRHYSGRSKPKSYHTAQFRHYSTPTQGLHHVISRTIDDGKDNMVQGWLNNIQALGSGLITGGGPTDHTPNSPKHLPRPQSLSPARSTSHALLRSRGSAFANPMSQPGGDRRHKRLRASFDGRDDSSVIAPREFVVSPHTRRPRLNPAAETSYHERSKNRRGPDAGEGGSSPVPSPPAHNFEKRPRHKTKSDRYDTVKNDGTSKKKNGGKRQKKAAAGSNKDDMKRSHLASAREVMNNFNSHSILSDRITMPPSLRPGLFDNGRVSKTPVTDLMFHDMSFLKYPQREPQKPPSRTRRRESENKRGEREREDIAAFFLHKTLPHSHDVQGRRQPDESGLSSQDGKICDDFFNSPERRHALTQFKLLPEFDQRHARAHESPSRAEREHSKQSTHISGSTNRQSTGPRDLSVSHARTLTSTPVRIREALAQSGIFDNTGIAFGNSHGHQGPEVLSKEGLASARSLHVSQRIGKNAQPDLVQPVRIVRYQDRGTMADDKVMGPEDDASHLPMQKQPCSSRAEPLDTARPAQSLDVSCGKITVSEALTGLCKKSNTSTNTHDTQMCDQVLGSDEASPCCQMAPERPRSPKCAVVERLETAAENMSPVCSPPATSATNLIDRQIPWSLAGHTIHHPSNADLMPTRSYPCVSSPGYDASRLSPGPVLTFLSRERAWLGHSASEVSKRFGSITDELSTPAAISQMQLPAVTHASDHTSSALPIEVRSESVTTYNTSRLIDSHMAHQSMQDYIAEIERNVLDHTDVGEGSGISSTEETILTLDPDLAEPDADVKHANAHVQPHVGPSGPYLQQAENNASPRNWAAVAELEEDEEQSFMSSYWRPHRNPT